ncbi:Uu.00g043870.m01.CDS01 [Anthostomella pinea]|uniref:Uu.00g043870.m01.CDS01 n=1 Tax=Anthostomella pinea TaxID=933095 RepID=A0AAI8VAR8_9PEZI|nr:Uu.00g043870.m01.CDS01 [Anthostomella pinea]
MNNFGVIELASTKTINAPGWAYVSDTGRGPHRSSSTTAGGGPSSSTTTTTTNRKRARAAHASTNLSSADASARAEVKTRREIEVLDRDNARDVNIAIPAKAKSSTKGGSQAAKKHGHTANVRKILQSQKTFANHLDDYVALEGANPGATSLNSGAGNAGAASSRGAAAAAAANMRKTQQGAAARRQSTIKQEQTDVEMPNAPSSSTTPAQAQTDQQQPRTTSNKSAILAASPLPAPQPHPLDSDPLLASRVPPLPTDDELRALISAPPLSYLEARAGWTPEDRRYPLRVFCEVCGYWGRVRCIKCGTRVCALECLETHREECVTRYGL